MSLLTIAATALELGPMAIRGVASLFGGSETAEKVAQTVEAVHNEFTSKDEKVSAINHVLEKMTPEQKAELLDLQVQMEKELTERQRIAAQDRQASHRETQLTIRNGDNATDEYVRRTRPKGCIRSLYSGIAYIMLLETLEAFGKGTGADWQLASFFFAPFMTYLGWRTADKAFEQKHGRPMGLKDGFEGLKLAGAGLVSKAMGARV